MCHTRHRITAGRQDPYRIPRPGNQFGVKVVPGNSNKKNSEKTHNNKEEEHDTRRTGHEEEAEEEKRRRRESSDGCKKRTFDHRQKTL